MQKWVSPPANGAGSPSVGMRMFFDGNRDGRPHSALKKTIDTARTEL